MADQMVLAAPQLHFMFGGRTYDIDLNDLDVGNGSTDGQIRQAVAEHQQIPLGKVQAYEVDRLPTGNLNLRPPATFGAF